MIYKDFGIPLRSSNVGEADKIFTILTKSNGKIQAVAKGIRKIQSRKRGNIEIGSISTISLYKGRNFDIIMECEMIDYFENLRSFEGIKFIFEILKITDKFANTSQSCDFLFHQSIKTLKIADEFPQQISILKPWFRLKVAQFESTFNQDSEISDERFKILINIFLTKNINEIFNVKITEQTLTKLELYSINSLSIK